MTWGLCVTDRFLLLSGCGCGCGSGADSDSDTRYTSSSNSSYNSITYSSPVNFAWDVHIQREKEGGGLGLKLEMKIEVRLGLKGGDVSKKLKVRGRKKI